MACFSKVTSLEALTTTVTVAVHVGLVPNNLSREITQEPHRRRVSTLWKLFTVKSLV
jgi:hypothetical protein